MIIHLIAIGKRMPNWVTTAYKEYQTRLPDQYKLNLIEVPAKPRTKNTDILRINQQESDTLWASIPADCYKIALDRQGKQIDTLLLAERLKLWHDDQQNICLLIGGPEGIAPTQLQLTNEVWSLSKLTLPHPMVRVIVAEQIYRAFSILSQHPYHRG